MTRVGRVYGVSCPAGVLRYVGSTTDDCRMQKHRYACKVDHLCCPFYRYAHEHHGGLDGYTEETLATLQLPEAAGQAKSMLRTLEALVIRSMRDSPTVALLNKNSPRAENERKRESGKAWRQQHGQGRVDPVTGKSASYMAIRSRIYRQRRKDRATALAAAAAAAAETAAAAGAAQ